MQNSVTVTIPFSFKGVEHKPSSVIDLDNYSHDDFGFVFHHVATENGIGNFSYEYEVLESSTIIFSEPTGLAKDFLKEGDFDLQGYKEASQINKVYLVLQTIASEALSIDNLEAEPEIKSALSQAFQAGVLSQSEE